MDEVMKSLLGVIDAEGPLTLTEDRTRRRGGYIRLGHDVARRAEKRGLATVAPYPNCGYAIIATITDKGRQALARARAAA